MTERRKKPEAIMICNPFQGHINPFVNLALKLASEGFSITFAHLDSVHHKLAKAHHSNTSEVDLFSEARKSGLDIRYTTISDGFPLEYDRTVNFEEYWEIILRDFPGRVDEFIGKIIIDGVGRVRFLVADTFFDWPAAIAEKYNLVNVSLWTQPALLFSLGYHWNLLEENGHFPCRDDIEEEIKYIPGVESINTRDLMSQLKESNVSTVVSKLARWAFEKVRKADFILLNTVQELEAETISVLNKYQPSYAIGPLNFYKNLQTSSVSRSLWAESDCRDWLESKPPGSVLYISFGSFVNVSKEVMEELAYGLLLSEVNFIWVVRQGILINGDTNSFPIGFEDEIKDKGLIVQWCNQIKVLSSPAVGGFLTHNGWNSTVESMWCGVPMICYPFTFDQPTNRKLVIDDWKIGINVCDGESFDRKEIAEKINNFMTGSVAKRFRQEANSVKTIMHTALEVDGSSERNFNQFTKDLEAKIHEKTTSLKKVG